MHFETLLDKLFDFLSERRVVVADFISKERYDYLSFMVPEQILLADEELKEF